MSCYPCRVMMPPDIWLALSGRRVRRLTIGVCAACIALTLPACLMELRPQSVGEITLVRGNVFLARAELMRPEPVMQSYPIFADDVIETQAQSGARISLPHGRLMLGPNTRLTFRQAAADGHTTVGLERGTLRMKMVASDAEDAWTVEILAAGSSTATHNGEVTVWVQEDFGGHEAAEPGGAAIRSVGAINHGSHGEATFHAMGSSVVLRPGYLSATAPNHPPVPAVSMEVAKPFVTDIVQTTNLELNASHPTAMKAPLPPPVKRITETIAQRACKKQKEQTLRVKPSVDQTKTRLTHCL
jgi:hypothetical protein